MFCHFVIVQKQIESTGVFMTSISEQNTHYRFIINGESCDPSNGIYDNVKNPSTGKTIAKVAMGNEVDVDLSLIHI